MDTTKRMPLKNIMGYGAAALGYNFVYMLTSAYVNIFFTNVLGISLAAVGIIMLVARIWDGINDPIMGSIVDKTNTSRGKYRPYLIWGMIPLAITTILLFYAPNIGNMGKVIYGAIIYILWGMSYTFANIPYMSMQSTLSFDSNERTKIITLKNIFTMFGIILCSVIVPGLAIKQDGVHGEGFLISGIIGAILVIVCMGITYKSTEKYKYVEDKKEVKITIKERVAAVINNKALILLAISLLLISIQQALIGASNYFFVDVLGRGDIVMIYTLTGAFAMLISMILMPIAMKFEKKTIMGAGMIIYALASIIFYFIPNTNISGFVIFNVIRGIGLGFCMIIIWSMIADSVDYATLTTGKQQGGIVFSTSTFMQKAAGGIGGALINFLLAIIGFVPAAEIQTAAASNGVKLLISIIPAVSGLIVAIIIMWKYPLTKEKMNDIQKKLGRA
ncbi:MFS transporter [Vallitalea sp.]|jgi:sugar (glycoside-pentoside-hexuronide) transporter|uniref:MFS transporter n=1 Tax=Vallitalea sp. TaxID=1882829 RepID=UPI0025CF9A1D|nr:glycoside-pentoside-hexuronide (GPH):cation symporter [Vallitalea sp.]MCT4685888.1 glycoside-pentoside-hexuronide (GPH):cation symporter [Vallitalea sp.]